MNTKSLVFALLAFTIFKGLILAQSIPDIVVPSLSTINIITAADFGDILNCDTNNTADSCGVSIFSVLKYIAFAIVFVIQLIINILIFLVQVVVLFVFIQAQSIPGIPTWLNFLLFVVPSLFLAMAIYNAVRGRPNND